MFHFFSIFWFFTSPMRTYPRKFHTHKRAHVRLDDFNSCIQARIPGVKKRGWSSGSKPRMQQVADYKNQPEGLVGFTGRCIHTYTRIHKRWAGGKKKVLAARGWPATFEPRRGWKRGGKERALPTPRAEV